MKASTIVYSLAAATAVSAQRPADQSVCDYYTTALLKNNTGANQQTLITLLVNTAVIGNYTKPNVGIAVPGILANGTGDFQGVSLIQYFTGALLSTNEDGKPASVNFLDDGGAVPLTMNKPANGTSSNQYKLLTHLYQYIGYLTGCSVYGNTTDAYMGSTNMYEVHKYMAIDENEFKYFVTQVGLSAASFGVSTDDVTAVGTALNNAFGFRCSAPASIPASAAPEPQSICIADDCPLAPNATCSDYSPVMPPSTCTTSTMMSTPMPSSNGSMHGNSSMTPSMTGSSGPAMYTGAASVVAPMLFSSALVAAGLVVLAL